MKLILIIIPFLVYCNTIGNQGSKNIKKHNIIDSEIFIYKNEKDTNSFYVENLIYKNDSIFRISFFENILGKHGQFFKKLTQNFEEIKSIKIQNNELFMDTLIIIEKNKIHFINGIKFIDTDSPIFNESLVLNNKLFISERKRSQDGSCNKITFNYINILISDSQYSYVYLVDNWIIQYNFPRNNTYKITECLRNGETKMTNVCW